MSGELEPLLSRPLKVFRLASFVFFFSAYACESDILHDLARLVFPAGFLALRTDVHVMFAALSVQP